MASVGITTQGVDTFVSTLGDAAEAMAVLAPERVGEIVADQARTRAPQRSGRLAASVHSVVASALVTITADAPYAPPVHNGWIAGGVFHRGQPFIVAATEATETRWLAAYETAAQTILNDVKGA